MKFRQALILVLAKILGLRIFRCFFSGRHRIDLGSGLMIIIEEL